MTTPPPLRSYRQMVRVVRDQPHACCRLPYQLARAYAEENATPVETRLRSLDEIGMDGRSPRLPEAPGNAGFLSTRESTTLFHSLDEQQQSYFRGISPKAAPTRQDGWSGTKSRAYLGGGSQESVTVTPPSERSDAAATLPADHAPTASSPNPSPHTAADLSYQPSALKAGKQTRLPLVERPSLQGIKGTDVEL
ncbi:hypothetical protein GCM10011297_13570 [Bacterioplanes sanyensis]|uniref:hypothetical protein n=1 Tax=Bacterioplanes sanyensis TaxID=1249553 RepID=UPI001672C3C3|nr:hypothetical protein [Bacterioplanes sanyensis]GGY41843.1 hypothetical protein GCM10011297_13570 [Bacterioplanes sanyensis]